MVPDPGPIPLTLATTDGHTLEAELLAADQAAVAAVVCHPHPSYGGDLHNHVVGHLFRTFAARGAALRFNFRGTGASTGQHAGGIGEAADVVAAIDAVVAHAPGVPLVLAGYSFGADVALTVTDPRVTAWLAVAPPLRVVEPDAMGAGPDRRPKVIVTGTDDEFRPPDEARSVTSRWVACEVVAVAGASHFFSTGLDVVAAAADDLVGRLRPRDGP